MQEDGHVSGEKEELRPLPEASASLRLQAVWERFPVVLQSVPEGIRRRLVSSEPLQAAFQGRGRPARAHVAWLDSLKEGKPCADCGRIYPPYVMEWDHLPGAKKTLVLSDTRRAAFSKKRILAELEKCELVCANCHRERTFGERAKKAA